MKLRSKGLLALVLAASVVTTACSAQWISVALADLPVLAQMAVNIASLVSTLQSGKQINPDDAAAIQVVANEATKDLGLIQNLYNQYKADPSATTLDAIRKAIAETNTNLPQILAAGHIKDAALLARVTAAVGLITATVSSFAALIPPPATGKLASKARGSVSIPSPKELKRQFNQQVCAPSGNASLDKALAASVIR